MIEGSDASTLCAVADDDKIVFGSDFPHSPARVFIAKKRHFEGNGKYADLIKKIYRENAARVMNF